MALFTLQFVQINQLLLHDVAQHFYGKSIGDATIIH